MAWETDTDMTINTWMRASLMRSIVEHCVVMEKIYDKQKSKDRVKKAGFSDQTSPKLENYSRYYVNFMAEALFAEATEAVEKESMERMARGEAGWTQEETWFRSKTRAVAEALKLGKLIANRIKEFKRPLPGCTDGVASGHADKRYKVLKVTYDSTTADLAQEKMAHGQEKAAHDVTKNALTETTQAYEEEKEAHGVTRAELEGIKTEREKREQLICGMINEIKSGNSDFSQTKALLQLYSVGWQDAVSILRRGHTYEAEKKLMKLASSFYVVEERLAEMRCDTDEIIQTSEPADPVSAKLLAVQKVIAEFQSDTELYIKEATKEHRKRLVQDLLGGEAMDT